MDAKHQDRRAENRSDVREWYFHVEPENGQGRPAESSFYFAYLVNSCQFAPRIVEKESDQSLILYLALNERRRNAEKCFLKLTELRRFPDCQFTSQSYYAKMLDPDYYKVLLEIGVGRRFWQSNPSAENAHAFYVRVVRPLRRLQRRGVVEKLQEITPTDDRTPIAVEIIGQVNLTKVK